MSESLYPPFLKWGEYTSDIKKKPDNIKIKVLDLETFETQYSINVRTLVKQNGKWNEINIPLKSHESKNGTLLNLWNRLVKQGKIEKDMELGIKTYLDISKNGRKIRRFSLEKL